MTVDERCHEIIRQLDALLASRQRPQYEIATLVEIRQHARRIRREHESELAALVDHYEPRPQKEETQ